MGRFGKLHGLSPAIWLQVPFETSMIRTKLKEQNDIPGSLKLMPYLLNSIHSYYSYINFQPADLFTDVVLKLAVVKQYQPVSIIYCIELLVASIVLSQRRLLGGKLKPVTEVNRVKQHHNVSKFQN